MTKILGIGNALVDIMTKLESDNTLQQFNLPKGSMQLVDATTSNTILAGIEDLPKSISSGGSAANAIHGLANMGVHTGFIGKTGDDKLGESFVKDMTLHHVQPFLLKSTSVTGTAIALVSPDSERTFAVHLGAAVELVPDDITPEMFQGYNYFHIEGYLVQNHDLLIRAGKLAKEKNLKVSLDLASYNVVEANLDFLKDYVSKYVDIVFANEEEAKAFTGEEPEKALNQIAKMCDIAIVKIGSKGSLIKANDEVHRIGIVKVKALDSTGAGDLYASGFLYGLSKGQNLGKCGEVGAVLAGNVMEVIGSKMEKDRWLRIYEMVKKIEK